MVKWLKGHGVIKLEGISRDRSTTRRVDEGTRARREGSSRGRAGSSAMGRCQNTTTSLKKEGKNNKIINKNEKAEIKMGERESIH